MKLSIVAGLSPQEAQEIIGEFKGAARLRERLSSILEGKIESKRAASRSIDAYASPSWAMLQADSIGYERALNEVISIISSKVDDK